MRKLSKVIAILTVAAYMGTFMASTAFAAQPYEVQTNDNLSKISRLAYGDAGNWKVIYEANKSQIKDPNLIYAKQVFLLPDASDIALLTNAGVAEALAAQTVAQQTVESNQTEALTPAVQEAQVSPSQTPVSVDINDVSVVVNAIASEATMMGYQVMFIRATDPSNFAASEQVQIALMNPRGEGFTVVYGPLGELGWEWDNNKGVVETYSRLFLSILNSDYSDAKAYKTAKSVDEMLTLLEKYK